MKKLLFAMIFTALLAGCGGSNEAEIAQCKPDD